MITQLQGRFRKRMRALNETDEFGFTLIELLVVIAILGILAAIVVFSVGGISDKGQYASCKTDTSTIQSAEEAAFAAGGAYHDMAGLRGGGFLSTDSTWHDATTPNGDPTHYIITEKGGTCGVAGHYVTGNIAAADAGVPPSPWGCQTNASKSGDPADGGWGDC